MAQPPVSEVTQELYDTSLKPLAYADEKYGWALLHLAEACAGVLQEVRDLAFPLNGYPNWAQSVNVDLCPGPALPWLGQFVGINPMPVFPLLTSDPEELYAKQRAYIKALPGFRRGTAKAIIAEMEPYLTGTKTISIVERPGGFAYRLQIRTKTSETPSTSDVLAAILRQKPAGILLDYTTLVGQDYQNLYTNHGPYSTTFTYYDNYQELYLDAP